MSIEIWDDNLFNQESEKISQNTTTEQEPKSLESGLENLEIIVKTLEQKDLPLEKALSLFKQGVGLVQYCSKVLDQAEKQMEILLEDPDGQLQIKPARFDVEG
ncbi:exonuclease VII small subunit [Desulfosporosinus orientis DSM 765]|uniref:Exodeoxyribonuclease 7 small subunit n=1 Tax=Desulfosporosinus orientis (strain ATCC 19365 / DSM 765 / NCIMB 8382 / VKM B-1628 / Singapore I) TaxID=768706 RepID=G7W871_DESOD|nr:exodeoxyribonuclease VII small subunit [Desulfosporosinus orientis]AET66717.1 exonuclease VII small subunit [Desulfosporosinus orientis DSM 765]